MASVEDSVEAHQKSTSRTTIGPSNPASLHVSKRTGRVQWLKSCSPADFDSSVPHSGREVEATECAPTDRQTGSMWRELQTVGHPAEAGNPVPR